MDTVTLSVTTFSALGFIVGVTLLASILIEERPARPVTMGSLLLLIVVGMSASAGLMIGLIALLLQTLLGWA